MNDLKFYRDCDRALILLMENEGFIEIEELDKISPDYSDMILHEFTKKGIAKYDRLLNRLEVIKDVARNYYAERFYERLGDKIEENIKRDKLSQLSTDSAVKSATAAKRSADSAILSILIALIALIFAILTYFFK